MPRVLFILANPSTANEIDNDPTIERQYRRVVSWGVEHFGSIEIVNGAAYRTPYPRKLYIAEDPIGPNNVRYIRDAAERAISSGGFIVCGWGTPMNKIVFYDESPVKVTMHSFLSYTFRNKPRVYAFKLSKAGVPYHPLYLPYSLKPRRWAFDGLHEEAV